MVNDNTPYEINQEVKKEIIEILESGIEDFQIWPTLSPEREFVNITECHAKELLKLLKSI